MGGGESRQRKYNSCGVYGDVNGKHRHWLNQSIGKPFSRQNLHWHDNVSIEYLIRTGAEDSQN